MLEVIIDFTDEGHITRELRSDEYDFVFTVREDNPMTAGVIKGLFYGQIWPFIENEAKLYFKAGIEPELDDIVLATYKGNNEEALTTVRYFEKHLEGYALRSSNPKHKDIFVSPEEDLTILGVCIAAMEEPDMNQIIHRDLARKNEIGNPPLAYPKLSIA